jgi:molybdate transport system ATP-binding protein
MASPVSLSIREGEQVAIVGANASGKTRLVEILTGHYRLRGDAIRLCFPDVPEGRISNAIRYITFCDAYGEIDSNYFLQLRWNQTEISEETPTVRQFLNNKVGSTEKASTSEDSYRQEIYRLFGLESLLDKYIVALSSGELRKCQLARVLLSRPRILIIDNPFIGLDTTACDMLTAVLQTIVAQEQLTLILVLPRTTLIPSFITHVIPVVDGHLLPSISREAYIPHDIPCPEPILSPDERLRILSLSEKDLSRTPFYPQQGGEILQFNNVRIRYEGRSILEDINWTVCEGERWALTGANGSGKSTLLSLVCADNPQGYACDIRLFGHRRGTGESIWEIKRHIGYVSPELHRAYRKNIPSIDLVASGFHDTVGLYTHATDDERERCLSWMEIFGIRHLATRPYLQLSSGEQRLCLLVRAFVKDPELLILDEPLHGLDEYYHQRVREIITTFCERRHKTLIMVTHHLEELPPCITHHMKLKPNY